MKIKAGDLVKLKDSDSVWMAEDDMGNKASVYSFINITNSLYRTLCKKEDIVEVKRPVKYETICKCEESILDDVEKRYLSAVIRPFRNKIVYITKYGYNGYDEQYILMSFDEGSTFCLPDFKKGTMYKNMGENRKYTLEELGL